MKKILKIFIIFQLSIISFNAYSAEITAIDSIGNVMGKVLPDGKVINLKNNIIGRLNADSQVVNAQGDIIGGIVPQGIAIGNDFKVLGHPSQDGKILSPSGADIGKVLPNSLVVNKNFDIIGAVLFPGIVYSDNGQYVGRLSGEGAYTDITGNKIGFITPDGYAYKQVNEDYILDGKLISSKMVFSLEGNLIGSISPEGSFLDLDDKEAGRVSANEFVYDNNKNIIGTMLKNSYAFDFMGNPMGFISYDGKIFDKKETSYKVTYNNIVINKDKDPVGFALSSQSTTTDLKGRFLGIVLPTGAVVKGEETKGFLNAKGVVIDDSGLIIGKLLKTGPVYDFKSNIVAHALAGGNTHSLKGAVNGYVKDKSAYDLRGTIRGRVYQTSLLFSNDNEFLGLSGITNKVTEDTGSVVTSNYGYLFNDLGEVIGQSLGLDFLYNIQGVLVGSITPAGQAQSFVKSGLGKIMGNGFVADEDNKTVAKTFLAKYLNNNAFFDGLLVLEDNIIRNKGGKMEAKILPDTSIVLTDKEKSVEFTPSLGASYTETMVISYDGKLLGYVDYDNKVRDFNSNNIGVIGYNKIALNNKGYPIGEAVGLGIVMQSDCSVSGVVDYKGEANSLRGVSLGKVLPQGFVLADGTVSGYSLTGGMVTDNNGSIMGYISNNGQVYNVKSENLGCINNQGRVVNNGVTLGAVVDAQLVLDFENNILGRSILNGSVVDLNSKEIGYVQPNNNVNSITNEPIGILSKYRYAFGNNNKFLGVINHKSEVINEKSEVVGNVLYDGSVIKDDVEVGYGLYDLYLYDNSFTPIAYTDLSGNAFNFKGVSIGSIKKGFLVDSKNSVIARPNRDYFIRTKDNKVLGELLFNGDVVDNQNTIIGPINKAGEVLDKDSKVLAVANYLQYYSIIIKKEVPAEIQELSGKKAYNKDGEEIGTVNENGIVVDKDGKEVGTVNEKGEVIDASGNLVGGVGQGWYEKITPAVVKTPKITTDSSEIKDFLKAISIALTPDGEFLGEILEDGSVVDANGVVVGKKQGDGLITSIDGELIGIEDTAKKEKDGEMFIPSGTFGNGGAYGTGNGNTNLGPGGGYGPGERYDATRSQALAAAQSKRRQALKVGKVSSGFNPSSFDYTQETWDGVNAVLSSWRVDMSEMILADKPIPAVLARSIYSSSTSVPVTAYVERNVYSEEGRNVIIPSGSRLIGKVGGFGASQGGNTNATKVEISWERLIRPDGSMFMLTGSVTGDAQGRQGALGYVDQKLMERYVGPVVYSVLSSAATYMMATDEDTTQEGETSSKADAASDARENFLDTMEEIFSDALSSSIEQQALIFVPAGTRIIVYPNQDLWLRSADREKSSSSFQSKDQKATQLIDDEIKTETDPTGSSNSASGGSTVVYESDGDAQAKSGGTSLIADKKTEPDNSAIVVPPPPPTSYNPSSSRQSSGGSSSSAPTLF